MNSRDEFEWVSSVDTMAEVIGAVLAMPNGDLWVGGNRGPFVTTGKEGVRRIEDGRGVIWAKGETSAENSVYAVLETRWHSQRAKLPVEFHYPRLPPGRYRLHVQATSAEGATGNVVVSPWIAIANPFWMRPPFFMLIAALLAALLYTVHRFLAQHRYARELESEVGRRVVQVYQAQEELARAERLSSLAVFDEVLESHDVRSPMSRRA